MEIRAALVRLEALDAERAKLRQQVWERLAPFAQRAQFASAKFLYFEIMIDWGYRLVESDYIEVEIPTELFYASGEENEIYWRKIAVEELANFRFTLFPLPLLFSHLRAKRQATVEARERAQYEKLKEKYGR
jgi:hypothetical protein